MTAPATISRLRLLNIRELRTHWVRALASVGVVAVSSALLVAVMGISGSITGSAERLAKSIGGNAELEVFGVTDAGLDESLLEPVRQVNGVAAAVPILRTKTRTDSGKVLLIGVDPSIQSLSSDLEESVRAQLQPGSALQTIPNAVVVGPAIGVTEGGDFDLGTSRVTAAVIVGDPSARRLNGGAFVVAPLGLAQAITGRERRLDSIMIVTQQGADVGRVRTEVASALGGRALVAEPSIRAAQAGSSFAIVTAMTLLVTLTTFIIAAFLSYNAMTLAIAQRRPIISTMRALGARRRTIVVDLLSEAAVLGLTAGAIGSVGGFLLGRITVGTLPPSLTATLEARTEYALPGYVVPLALAAATATSVIASAVAARQVHSIAPVEALVPTGAGSAEVGSRPLRMIAGISGVICVVGAVLMVTADLGRAAMASIAVALTGATAITFAFAGPLMRTAAAVARRCGPAGTLGATSIERAPRRMLVAAMTVMIAVANAVAVTGINDNVIDSTLASFSSLATTDVWVTGTPATAESQTTPLPPDVESRLEAVPGVGRVVPGQLAFATVNNIKVMIVGTAPGSHQNMYQRLSHDNRARFDAGQGIALSRDLARTMEVADGGSITLQTPSGERRVEVLEVLPVFAAMYGTIAMSLTTMQQWFSTDRATSLEVTVAPGSNPDDVRRAIERALPRDVYVYSGSELMAALGKAIDEGTSAIFTVAWIIVAVSAITLLNTLMLSVLDRRREIGVLRAIGATRRITLNVIAAEAIGVGVVGGLLGLLFGAASQYLAADALTDVLGIDVIYRFQPMMVAIGFGALVICLLGSVPPAIRAGRLNIVDAVSVD